MNDIDIADSLEAATMRMDRALERLEKTTSAIHEQSGIISKLQKDVESLSQQNNNYASNFERLSKREKKLAAGAKEVSERLVNAMEEIKSVLVK